MKAREAYEQGTRRGALTNWQELQEGDLVRILRDAKTVSEGSVEEVSRSGRVLWIVNAQSQSESFFKSDGVLVQRK
jgi:hypothetical protein